MPGAWEVTIGGITDYGCNYCEEKNGVYIAKVE